MKVYLSKSGEASPVVHNIVKNRLLALGHQVIEFTGGTYDPNIILQADKLIIVPPSLVMGSPIGRPNDKFSFNDDSTRSDYDLGMGQVKQIIHWLNKKDGDEAEDEEDNSYSIGTSAIMVVTEVTALGEVTVDCVNELNLSHINAQDEWGYLYLDSSDETLLEKIGKGANAPTPASTSHQTSITPYQASSTGAMLAVAKLFNIKF